MQTILLPHARSRWMTPYAANMTPARIEMVLRSALTGDSPAREQELYTLMESTWPRLLKNTMEIKDAVLGLDWNLMDVEEEDQFPGAKELIERTKNGMKGDPYSDGHGWRATLGALLDAKWRGVSICEIVWEYRESRKFPAAWLPKQTRDLSPNYFGWQVNTGRLMLYPDQDSSKAVDFPANQFLCAISKAGKGHPSGTALLRCLAWWWCSANFSAEWLLNFAQIFGQPFRWATYDASQDGVKDDLAAMMEAMGSAAYGVGPDGTKIEWHEASKSGADNPQSYILTLADTACDLLILGQTLTSTQGSSGSLALGEVHQSVRADIIDSTALWLAEILNEQLIPAVIALNYGDVGEDSGLPWFQPTRKSQKDTKVIAETFKILLDAGIPLKQDEVYDALDLSKPEAMDEIFGPSQDAAPPAADSPPGLSRMLAKLPLDAREYFLAKLLDP
jgi:phage gp29-like protein